MACYLYGAQQLTEQMLTFLQMNLDIKTTQLIINRNSFFTDVYASTQF